MFIVCNLTRVCGLISCAFLQVISVAAGCELNHVVAGGPPWLLKIFRGGRGGLRAGHIPDVFNRDDSIMAVGLN